MGTPSLLLLLLVLSSCRVYDQTFTHSAFRKQDGWIYLTKMVFAPGTSTISFQSTVKGALLQALEVELALISDTVWAAESEYKCSNAQHKPDVSIMHSILPYGESSTSSMGLTINQDHLYYLVLRDCKRLIAGNNSLSSIVMESKLVILNSDSHLGSEEDSWFVYPLVIVVGILLAVRINNQNPWQGEKNWIQVILLLGILARTSAMFWKCVGFFIYWKYGNNYTIFQIFYLALHGLSECIIICIVVLVSFGWYILFVNHEDFDIFISLLSLLGVLNVVLNVLNVINDDSHDKYHMYDSIPTIIQTAFRLIALFCMIGGIKTNWGKLSKDRRTFMVKFAIYGLVYILSLPVMALIARLVSKNERQEFVLIWSEVFQMLSSIFMTYLTTSKYSSYSKVNINNTTFLPDHQNDKYF